MLRRLLSESQATAGEDLTLLLLLDVLCASAAVAFGLLVVVSCAAAGGQAAESGARTAEGATAAIC